MKLFRTFLAAITFGFLTFSISLAAAEKKKVVLVAGTPSHGPGDHEFNAGCLLLKKCLDQSGIIETVVQTNGWPKDEAIFQGADAIFIYSDGGGGHPAIRPERLKMLDELVKKGVGIGCGHYAVEVPKDKGGPEFLNWIGGYFEAFWSVNPHWVAEFKEFPRHPITRGVKPFQANDEWYFHMRFREGMQGVTPILTAVPPDKSRGKPGETSTHGGNPHVQARQGQPEHMMWAYESPGGSRGFGFTGGHRHSNWAIDDFRKVVLNAIVWMAKAEVPQNGVQSRVTEEDLKANLDPKGANRPPRTLAAANTNAAPRTEGPQRASGPEAARADLQKMTVAPGLEVTVFSSEPMLRNPTDMDIDARGRVWITEGVNYRSSFQRWGILRPEGDRIVILEDTNGDGTADLEKVFYQGKEINAALGICVLGKRVIVSCSPNVFEFRDDNGDDKADGPPKVIFSGIKGVDHDHGVHAFVFGPDGKLYFNMGDAGAQLKTADGSFVRDLAGNEVNANGKPYRKGLAFRCQPDFSRLETVGWNFRNNYELAVDSFGTIWQSDNDDDGNKSVRINYVMEFGNFGYSDELTGAGWGEAWKKANLKEKLPDTEKPRFHWHQDDPGVVPNLLVTGSGSPTGILFYEGRLLPEPFRNQMIHCEPGHNVVRAYPVKPAGAGYEATTVDLLKCSDSWFRPSDVCVAPDGSVLIADWNDPGVGGHNMGDREVNTMRGRVYRVAPRGTKYLTPRLDLRSAAGAAQALQSPNLEARYLAWTALNQMGARAEKELVKLYEGRDPVLKARALHLLARIPGKEKQYVNRALKEKNPDLRVTGLRIARERQMDLVPILKTTVRDDSPAVRRESAIALRHLTRPEGPALWTQLARQHQPGDRWSLEALGIAADRQEDAFFEAWLKSAGNEWNSPAGREIIWRSRSAKAAPLLVKLINAPGTTAEEKSRLMRSFDYLKGPEKEAALLELLGVN